MVRSREFDFGMGPGAEKRQMDFQKMTEETQRHVQTKVPLWEKKIARAVAEGAMPDLKAIVERIDFQTLHEILSEYMSRSGVGPDRFNLLEKSDVLPGDWMKMSNSFADYELLTNKIFINLKKLKSENEQSLTALQIIIHELVHAASAFLYRNHGIPNEDMIKLGYAQQKGLRSNRQYSAFDEAVTEKVAQEVMEKYAQRTGMTKELELFVSNENKFSPYVPQIEFLENTINKIAAACGVPADAVWDAVKKGKFGNSELDDPGVEEELVEIFNAKFVKRLKGGKLEDMVESHILRIRMKINRFLNINLF